MSSEWKPGDVIPERYSGMPVTFKWNEVALTAMLGALRDGYEAGYHSMVGHIQDAMRDFTPPRPDEPTGLGAVVLDAEGGAWVNSHPRDKYPWVRNADDGSGYESCQYADIAAVRVLSEGVCDV